MRTFTLNVGLENNPLNAYQIEELINYIIGADARLYYRQETGEYNGQPEKTLIVVIAGAITAIDRYQIKELVQLLCTICTQECIPVKGDGYAELIYNSNFEGEKYSFDPQYFINF